MNTHIAIPYADGEIFPHFGKSTQFKIYAIEDDKVVSADVRETGGIGHEDLGIWLLTQGVKAVVCGGIGPGALGALVAAGITPLAGVSGSADEAIEKLLAGTLQVAQSATCGGHGGGCAGSCGHCHGGACGGH